VQTPEELLSEVFNIEERNPERRAQNDERMSTLGGGMEVGEQQRRALCGISEAVARLLGCGVVLRARVIDANTPAEE